MKKYLIIFLFLPLYGKSQIVSLSADTITWTSGSNTNLHTQESFSAHTVFKTFAGSKIEMIIEGESSEFAVTATEGAWDGPPASGTIAYVVDYYGTTGVLQIERTENGAITITIDLSSASETGMKQKFFIDSYAAQ